jgi:dihydroorotate dehydrogenase
VLPDQRTRSLHRATVVDAKKYAIIQRYIHENKGNAIMSRATMSEIAHRVFSLAYPHFYTFKNVALRVKDSHLFDLSRVRCEVEKVKRAKTNKRVTTVENTAIDASHMIETNTSCAQTSGTAQIETVEDACARIESDTNDCE